MRSSKPRGWRRWKLYLPKAWQRFLQNSGESIQQLGLEAFALLLEKRGASDLVETARKTMARNDEAA